MWGPGDEVVTSAFTYFATVEAILLAGARPVFADIEKNGFGIDPAGVEAALGPRTKAIVPVHLFGRCADMPRLEALAAARGVAIVEDAAQAIGAVRAGRRAGAWGRAGCFSFYPSKNLGGVGDGGCVTTDDPQVAERVRLYRSHGCAQDGAHQVLGTTARLDALQAAALRAKLPYLDGLDAGAGPQRAHLCRGVRGLRGDRDPRRRGRRDAGLEPLHDPLSPSAGRARRAGGRGDRVAALLSDAGRLASPRWARRAARRGASPSRSGPAPRRSRSRSGRAARRRRSSTSPT